MIAETFIIYGPKGERVIVDEDTFEVFAHKNGPRLIISSEGYPAFKIGKEQIYLHRFVIGARSGTICDHINRNTHDCRRINLRIVSKRQNAWNSPKFKRPCSSRFKGVTFRPKDGRWVAHHTINRRFVHIGIFSTELEAARAYNATIANVRGEYAVLNQV